MLDRGLTIEAQKLCAKDKDDPHAAKQYERHADAAPSTGVHVHQESDQGGHKSLIEGQ